MTRQKGGASQDSSFLHDCATVAEVHQRVETCYNALVHVMPDGSRRPYVCVICDEFILQPKHRRDISTEKLAAKQDYLQWDSFKKRRNDPDADSLIKEHFTVSGDGTSELSHIPLSPRSAMERKGTKNRRKTVFSCCQRCYNHLYVNNTRVYYCIGNKNYVGCTPQCLLDLTDIEVALLTPVKSHGFCFSYSGGTQLQLKGTCSFMRVKERSTARAILQLEALGLTKNILVLSCGNMTPGQYAKTKTFSRIRTDKVFLALDWLHHHHKKYKTVDIHQLRQELRNIKPVFIDTSKKCPSANANIEEEELFECFFPDGSTNEEQGGWDDPDAFRMYVEKMKQHGTDIEFKCNLEKEFVQKEADSLVDACLLQFPYGVGGLEESRMTIDGRWSKNVDIEGYLQHLTRLSQPVFQRQLFLLIVFNICCKRTILNTARFQLRGEAHASAIAAGVNYSDLVSAACQRSSGNYHGGTHVSKSLLDVCDASGRALPHTNEGARKARGNGEAMQHHFGIASVWLTVTFDDKNSLLVQILNQEIIDDETPVSDLTEDECCKRTKRRNALRVKYPGMTSIHFEMLWRIFMEEIVGWDIDTNTATGKPGFFGTPYAVTAAFEEQARKTIHGHLSLWIEDYREIHKNLFFGTVRQKEAAGKTMMKYHERIASTEMMEGGIGTLRTAFDHPCTVPKRQRQLPQVVSEQQLRILRHKKGYKETDGLFAQCPHCNKKWTYEDLLGSYVVNILGITDGHHDQSGASPNCHYIPLNRLYALVVEHQKENNTQCPPGIINATYNHHDSRHTGNCFKCTKYTGAKKRNHQCDGSCECRYRMPDRKRQKAMIRHVQSETTVWFEWNGKEKKQPLVEFLPKRRPYDLFQNVCCPAISYSKLGCNSNVQLITDGPLSQYAFKYQHKGNQEEESAPYGHVQASIKNLVARKYAADRSEAVRVLVRAAFAHNKSNIIAAGMASFLVRNKSRFFFSHTFQYCPLKDTIRLLHGKSIGATVEANQGQKFFETQALHYLCRPTELEACCMKTFFEGHQAVKLGTNNRDDDELMLFVQDTGSYKHPAYREKKMQWLQGVLPRETATHIKVSQWSFPDTCQFNNDIRTCSENEYVKEMEIYAQLVLVLLLPFREINDFGQSDQYLFTKKLQAVWKDDEMRKTQGMKPQVFSQENMQFLQNIQDCGRNAMRYKIEKDDLQSVTEPFVPKQTGEKNGTNGNNDEDEVWEETAAAYDKVMRYLDEEDAIDPNDDDPMMFKQAMHALSFEAVRDKGRKNCGYHEIGAVSRTTPMTPEAIHSQTTGSGTTNRGETETFPQEKIRYQRKDIVRIRTRTSEKRVRESVFKANPTVEVADANGTVASIIEWAIAARLDQLQRRAFECICSAFLLTFFDPEDNDESSSSTRREFDLAETQLKKLRGTGDEHLIMLLHGPGGSGKSMVINLVIDYAKDFCKLLDHPFTSRTIVVTALSGVAATLILGQTTHKALRLNAKKIKPEECEEFRDARLIFIDEISFMGKPGFPKADSNLKQLCGNHYEKYGGKNMVFSGDFFQMEPVKQESLYDGEKVPEFHYYLNAYIELNGMHRFRDDIEWGEINMRFRKGEPTMEDIHKINNNCLIRKREEGSPVGVQVATYYNSNRDAVNAAIFEDYCEQNRPENDGPLPSACLIFMDELVMRNEAKRFQPVLSNTVKRYFYENCAENDLKTNLKKESNVSGGRCDSVLKLYYDCPLMFTLNSDVDSGQANGSRVRFRKVYKKYGEEAFIVTMASGTKVQALFASQVKSIEVKHENDLMRPQLFQVEEKKWKFQAQIRIGSEKMGATMKGCQFPVVSNSATTGHKLQGCTVPALLVNDWRYCNNWAYVVLSRVTTMSGLFLKQPLSSNLKDYEMKKTIFDMLKTFEDEISLRLFSEDEYNAMSNADSIA